MNYAFCVIGGGIVGLATAMKLLEMHPGASLAVLEKENSLGRHQTGHNSGVIHAGIYYAPGSFKAELCRRGAQATKEFCSQHGIPFEVCGKMLVATNEVEARRMEELYRRSVENNVEVEKLDSTELKSREPNITGVGALFVPSTGIVNYRLVCEAIGRVISDAGGQIEYGVEVDRIQETEASVTIGAGGGTWAARRPVACAGLQSDRVARIAGLRIEHQIVPFRGEYYRLPPSKRGIITSLIYPIPDPDLPFLGIHLTRMIDGGVTVGPNAVLGFAREGYPKLSFNLRDVAQYLRFPGLWKVLVRYRSSIPGEIAGSLAKSLYLKECRKYCPSLTERDLLPYTAGIRAQAVTREGELVHDFLFLNGARSLHVCNAPSPA